MLQSVPAVPPEELQVRFVAEVPVLVIPEYLDFETLREWLRVQVPAVSDLIGGHTSRLDLGSRPIALFDLRRLVHLLDDELGVNVSGLYACPEAIQRFAERELKLKLFVMEAGPGDLPTEVLEDDAEPGVFAAPHDLEASDEASPSVNEALDDSAEVADTDADAPDTMVDPPETGVEVVDADHEPAPPALEVTTPGTDVPSIEPVEAGERRTKRLFRTIRSGSVVRFDGDLLIFGDVNPGAHVVATGNIIVLGALQGMAHAGASGDVDAFLLALAFHPTQLRIASAIALPPERPSSRALAPEIAVLRGDSIVIRPYKGRLPA